MDSEDAERLPPGFQRIGYDADDQIYFFSSPDGRTYQSAPGCRYGVLTPVGERRSQPPRSSPAVLRETRQTEAMIKKDSSEATRVMLPFALLVFIFLILVFKLINRSDNPPSQVVDCGQGSHQVQIQKGDTCWSIGEEYSLGVDELLGIGGNEEIDCDNLKIGQAICVPK